MWWRRSLPKHLPLPQGPYTPGCTDVITGFGKESTFLRIYYPSAIPKENNDSSKWFGWSPHHLYVEGLARLINSWGSVIKMLLWIYGDNPLGEPHVPAIWEAEPEGKPGGRKLPVVVFSHGYGATRFLSSTIGYELASRGFFTAFIEHRDSSPSATYYYENAEAHEKDERTWIPHMKIEFGPDHYKIRNEQLHKRTKDVINTLDLLESIEKGEASNILKTYFDINQFKGRLELSALCMMGHSFGGATTLLAMAQDQRISCGVVLDGWMFPLKEEKLELTRPLLFINTLTFHIESNLKVMETFLPGNSQNEIYTMRNTTHESQTDTPHILGYWLNWFMPKLNPVVGTNINNHLTLRFLNKVLGFPDDTSESNKYLQENEKNFVQGTLLYSKAIPKRKL